MTGKGAEKTSRVLAAIEHREPDRVPRGEFFWTNFIRRAKAEGRVGADFNPYSHWDLDLIVINPNMDPRITGIQVLEDAPERKVVKTGYGATILRQRQYPMPHYDSFDTQTFEQMEAFVFDDPKDPRRYFEAIDDQINCVGDELNLGLPSWIDRVNSCAGDYCVFGSVCEIQEQLWRMIGSENLFYKLGEDPDRLGRFIERVGDFLVGIVEGQIEAARGKLSGLYVWGDIAYVKGMLFSPSLWRRHYKPQLQRICRAIHAAGLKVIYHGCGNASAVFEDMIEAGVDMYNPLEAKAGLDVVDLKRRFGRRLGFNGNINVQALETNDREKVRREALRKLNAAKGGGYIFQSDHSVPDTVDFETYDYAMELVREYGRYPLDLGECDEEI
jgi:hypothetical protein